jgi:hypothetical protein
MALIFDGFPTMAAAEAFAAGVRERDGRGVGVFPDQAASEARIDDVKLGLAKDHEADVFPWRLAPPIVLVSREGDDAEEETIVALAEELGGDFAGT